jgi:hypothetical protein
LQAEEKSRKNGFQQQFLFYCAYTNFAKFEKIPFIGNCEFASAICLTAYYAIQDYAG